MEISSILCMDDVINCREIETNLEMIEKIINNYDAFEYSILIFIVATCSMTGYL